MSTKLKELFKNCQFDETVGNGIVLSVLHNEEKRSLVFQVEMNTVPDVETILNANEEIKKELELSSAEIYPKYPTELFSAEQIPHIIRLIKNGTGIINGYLTDIEIDESDNVFEITLKNGGKDILVDAKIDRKIEKFAKGFFDVDISILFDGVTDASLEEHENKIKDVQCACVDGETIKADVWYTLSEGKFEEA